MRRTVVAVLAAVITALGLIAVATPASAATNDVAIGTFASRDVVGYSVFIEKAGAITVVGSYFGLKPNRAYFTVIYGNTNCDPVAAFPIGPFYTNRWGVGSINQSMANPNGVSVGGTGSVSVRRGDNQSDIDHDGLLGPTDVVAVPGSPSIGLIHCNTTPTVIPA